MTERQRALLELLAKVEMTPRYHITVEGNADKRLEIRRDLERRSIEGWRFRRDTELRHAED